MELNKETAYIIEIKEILQKARQKAYTAINTAMVEAYWLIGKRIVEEEQNGKDRAAYGKEIVKNLSKSLQKEFGKGFSERTLWEIRQFYQTFSEPAILRTAFAQLTWSHFQRDLRNTDEKARMYYLQEAANQNWSIRTLDRNILTLYYQRLISTQKKDVLQNEMIENTKPLQNDDFIRNPTVLDFLNIPTNKAYSEEELEQGLIDNLQQFLLELGKGFSFVARQKHIRTEHLNFI